MLSLNIANITLMARERVSPTTLAAKAIVSSGEFSTRVALSSAPKSKLGNRLINCNNPELGG
jgi:hypothetical protein